MNIKNTFVLPLLLAGALSYAETISANLYPGDGVTWSTSSIWEIDGTSADRLPGVGDQIVITTTDDGSGFYSTLTAVAGNNAWGVAGSLTLNGPTHLKFASSNSNAWGNITLNSGSSLEVVTNNWGNFKLMTSGSDTVNFAVEKGASFVLSGANFLPQGSHNSCVASTANIDIRGNFSVSSGCVLLSEARDSVSNFNVYGSATISSYTTAGSRDFGFTFGNGQTATVNMTFKMQDVRLSAISGFTDSTVALIDTNSIGYRGAVAVSYIIDFADFSIDGGSFDVGQTYNFALISAASGLDESIFDKISISNESALGSEWALAEDYLSISDNTLYLNLSRVPEPSTYAAIFAILALALAVYKKHR